MNEAKESSPWSPTHSTSHQPVVQRTVYQRWVEDWWLLELLAVVASCAFTTALCALLWAFDNQQVWNSSSVLHGGITIGTVIALLATLSVTCALHTVMEGLSQLKWTWYTQSRSLADLESYDSASRGPSGSFWLLWKLRIVRSPLASLGAFLMIVQLIVAPLAQQTIQIVSTQVPDTNGTASVRVTSQFGEPDFSRAINMPQGYGRLNPGMKGAIMNGMFTSLADVVNDTVPLCTTGNCTFDPYPTLSVCRGVDNVTSSLKVVDSYSYLPGFPQWKKFCLQDTELCLNVSQSVKTPQPGVIVGSSAGPPPNISNTTSNAKAVAMGSLEPPKTFPLNFSSIAFPKHRNPIADVYIVYWPRSGFNYNSDGLAALAVEFMLDWCVVWMQTTVVNGIVNTTGLNNTTPIFDYTTDPALFGGMEGYVDGTLYGVDNTTHFTLQRHLQRVFNGTVYFDGYGYVPDSDVMQVLSNSVGIANDDLVLNNPNDDPLYPLELMLTNTVTSMANYVRTSDPLLEDREFAPGIAFSQRNIVRVSWGWIAAPIFFSVVSLVFFLLVVVCGARGPAESKPLLWRSSSVAILHGLDADVQRLLGGMRTKSYMNTEAKQIRVRLRRSGPGWRLTDKTTNRPSLRG